MALGSNQPLTEMSTGEFPWGKCGRCIRLITLPLPCAVVMKSGNLNFLEPSGPLQACNGTDLPFYLLISLYNNSTQHLHTVFLGCIYTTTLIFSSDTAEYKIMNYSCGVAK